MLMENKKIIGIDINEVIRSRSMQFDRFYYEEFDGKGLPPEDDPYKFDLRNDYKWEDGEETLEYLNEDLPDDISPKDYVIDKNTGKAPVDVFAFKKEKKLITGDEKFKRFMYEDYLFEIHGTAPPIYKGLDKHLEKFYLKYRDQFELRIISKENWFTIPPTLFFLSKMMLRFTDFKFVKNNTEVWENVDILITTDPELLECPDNKKVVKINRPYNKNIESKVVALQVYDLIDNKEFQELIGYIEPKVSLEENNNNNSENIKENE